MRLAYEMAELHEAALIAALRDNVALVAELAADRRRVRQSEVFNAELVPSLGVQMIGDTELETEIPLLYQFDAYAPDLAHAKRIRRLTLDAVHSDYTRDFGGLLCWSEYRGGSREPDPVPGVSRIRFDIEYHPYREYSTIDES